MKKFFTKQWSFFWAGVGFGVAQIIYMIAGYAKSAAEGKGLVSTPITVTTNLGGMFRAIEVFWWGGKTFGLENGLYGSAFKVDTWGPILGIILGGLLVALAEKESRSWAKYSPKMLLLSLFGGAVFSYGTRLADGCTLNHLLGGIPLMSIKATVVSAFMAIGGLTAFWAMSKTGLGKFFKHQETKSYVKMAQEKKLLADGFTFDANYNPWTDPWRWVGIVFLVMFIIPAVYYFFSPESKHSIPNSGAVFMWLSLAAGVIGGFAMGKSGFGTECALVSVEAAQMFKKDEDRWAKLGIPAITRTLMKGLLPLQGLLASIVLTGVFAVGAWVLFNVPLGFQSPVKNQLSWISLLGGFFLGFGAVALVGCEIRSYMRLGLGYTNTLIGFIGFALGYLPFTLFYDFHKALLENTVFVETYTWGQLLFPENIGAQQIFAVLWTLALAGLLVWAIRAGARNLNRKPAQILNQSTEELEVTLKGLPEAGAAD